MLKNIFRSSIFKDQIAVLLIIGAFVSIIVMLGIHLNTTGQIIVQYQKVQNNTENSQNMISFLKDINASNLNIFSIIFSLFGAWIGAVLAFYFGSKSIERAYDSLNKSQQSIDNIISDKKLLNYKVKQILDNNPTCKDILPVTITTSVKDVVKQAKEKNYSFVMIADNEQSPKKISGLLFISDLKAKMSEEHLENEAKTVQEFLDDPNMNIVDHITKQRWISKTGVKNFVETTLEETLKSVHEKMIKKDPSLSVRAVVFDKDLAIATITYENILNTIEK